jgi:hypothetical protein
VHLQAHAHNDYEHSRPLFDALDNRFMSVEADIHLVAGSLIVSHDQPDPLKAKTLEELYLKPLDSISRSNKGSVYANHHTPLLLMIDIKTPGDETFYPLQQMLTKYQSLLNTPSQKGAVQILVSGNRPIELIRNDPARFMTIDGRPEDLDKNISSDIMPVISDAYKNHMTWTGTGDPLPAEIDHIKTLAKKIHTQNKKFRLWATPDTKAAWQTLLDAGVDLINTDKLEELNSFLTEKGK